MTLCELRRFNTVECLYDALRSSSDKAVVEYSNKMDTAYFPNIAYGHT
jgi:hypothetical protein